MLGLALTFVIIGVWAYAIIDVVGTPPDEVRVGSKLLWIVAVALFWIPGAVGWFLFGRPRVNGYGARAPRRAVSDHPAFGQRSAWEVTRREAGLGRPGSRMGTRRPVARPKGPDDDPEFLRELTERIRGGESEPPSPSRG
ncbi:PLD nuclease N-terminal domain-containing protein [Frankia sp. AgPm24]|uniref:PLD nuclease N-terminal domain-containing protein n=1 Tax=Frankia umida TaxID=573489 RepID=A0ABT0JT75_9ACTN|nr:MULTISPECIES: PLD nuclease N-terminal domain-containing protein [Frankia]MCK9874775.1 PLD nuclease N-terminal domain-containing protein [Frankia umida]MCK9924550.1 PLD nuclease N-terminal domain-containing protein [Frankia sp. AgPm24]